ncbi:Bug family tripartite tricarboxylate transporter substrate binding protein [Candidimonas nitroreducens]|nr:tripartite tricarboxylate transporter substrate binding protein [Candidimonas nitroreducens]
MKRLFAAMAACAVMAGAYAQGWPEHSIKYIVPYDVGGSTDTLSRIVAGQLQARLGQPVVVENFGGAGAMIGTERLAKSPADGYTIGLGNTASHTVTPNIQLKVPYDPKKDFAPISLLAEYANILVVNPRLPVKTLKDFIEFARKQPGGLSYASSGVGSSNHLGSELLARMAGLHFTHVPYKGNSRGISDVVAGHVDWMFATPSEVISFVRSGQLRALGTSGLRPEELLPDVPPIFKTLPGYEVIGFMGLFAPAGTPAAIVDRLNREINAILAEPEVAEKYAMLGMKAVPSTPQALGQRVEHDYQLWRRVIAEAGIKAQ